MDKSDCRNEISLRISLFYEKIPVLLRMISGTRGIRIKGGTKGRTQGHFFSGLVFRQLCNIAQASLTIYVCDVRSAREVKHAFDVKSACEIFLTSMASTWDTRDPGQQGTILYHILHILVDHFSKFWTSTKTIFSEAVELVWTRQNLKNGSLGRFLFRIQGYLSQHLNQGYLGLFILKNGKNNKFLIKYV